LPWGDHKEKLEPDPSNQVGPAYASKVHRDHGAGGQLGDVPYKDIRFLIFEVTVCCGSFSGLQLPCGSRFRFWGLVSKPLSKHIENTSLATRSDDLKGGASDECGPGRGVLRKCHPEVSQHLRDFPFPGKAQRETPLANYAASWIDFRKILLAGLAVAGGRFGDIPSI
jgi:hypothetical protein